MYCLISLFLFHHFTALRFHGFTLYPSTLFTYQRINLSNVEQSRKWRCSNLPVDADVMVYGGKVGEEHDHDDELISGEKSFLE